MFKNVASQKVTLLAIDTSTNTPKTGDAANLTAYRQLDDGTLTVLGDTSATEVSSTNAPGNYTFDLTQAETNGDKALFTGKSSTSNVSVIPQLVYTVPASWLTGLDAAGIRSAIGLATNDLDTQLDPLATVATVAEITTAMFTEDTGETGTGAVAGSVVKEIIDNGSGGTGLTAAETRAALGMAAADFDTQIGALPTNAELATSQAAADDATLAAIAALSIPTVAQIWNALTSGFSTSGSAGKLLVDNLNATVSSRASQTSVDAIGTDVDGIASLLALMDTDLDGMIVSLAAIKAKTDLLIFTNSGMLDVYVKRIGSANVQGAGILGNLWRPV